MCDQARADLGVARTIVGTLHATQLQRGVVAIIVFLKYPVKSPLLASVFAARGLLLDGSPDSLRRDRQLVNAHAASVEDRVRDGWRHRVHPQLAEALRAERARRLV